jgi:hypothetical protein
MSLNCSNRLTALSVVFSYLSRTPRSPGHKTGDPPAETCFRMSGRMSNGVIFVRPAGRWVACHPSLVVCRKHLSQVLPSRLYVALQHASRLSVKGCRPSFVDRSLSWASCISLDSTFQLWKLCNSSETRSGKRRWSPERLQPSMALGCSRKILLAAWCYSP